MKKYSNNAGKPVTGVKVVGLAGAMSILRKLRSNGQTFRIDWIKKDGSFRTASSARFGVHAGLSGDGMKYDSLEKGYLTIFEFGKGWKQVRIDGIQLIKHGGVVYLFNSALPTGEYSRNVVVKRGRTVPAHTSPMYAEV